MGNFTFGGISGVPTVNKDKVDELHESCFIYDELFEHREQELNFFYRYALEITDLESACGDEGFMFSLYLTIHRDSLSEKVKEEILNGDSYEINPYDLIIDGRGIIPIDSEVYKVEIDEVDDIAYKILSFVPMINGMRGFFLDRAWNRIGTTGWDSVNYALGKRDNLF